MANETNLVDAVFPPAGAAQKRVQVLLPPCMPAQTTVRLEPDNDVCRLTFHPGGYAVLRFDGDA